MSCPKYREYYHNRVVYCDNTAEYCNKLRMYITVLTGDVGKTCVLLIVSLCLSLCNLPCFWTVQLLFPLGVLVVC